MARAHGNATINGIVYKNCVYPIIYLLRKYYMSITSSKI